jgi:competence ComEA-like helix-hairpin-helix protein
MQNCTRMYAVLQSLERIVTTTHFFAIILLVLCSGLKADEPLNSQSLNGLGENQDPGWNPTRSVPVTAVQQTGLVNINNATVEELATALPGIGPGKAQRIVDWRNDNGAFQYLDQLLEVSGIGPKTLERITPYIHLGDAGDAVSSNPSQTRDPEHRWVLLDIVNRADKDAARVLRELPGS